MTTDESLYHGACLRCYTRRIEGQKDVDIIKLSSVRSLGASIYIFSDRGAY